MNNAAQNIKSWEKLKKTGQKKYILLGGLWWSVFVWAFSGLLNKHDHITFSEMFFSEAAALRFLFFLVGGFLCFTSLWYFHKYLYKKAILNKRNNKTYPMINSEKKIKVAGKIKKTSLLKYSLGNAIFFSLPIWIITNLLNKTPQNTYQQVYFSKHSISYLLLIIILYIFLFCCKWYFHRYQYKKSNP